MKPGFSSKIKTGNGLPSNLMGGPKMKSCGPMMTTPSTTPLYKKKNISFKEYRESGDMPASEAKFYQGSGTKRVEDKSPPKPKKEVKKRKGYYTKDELKAEKEKKNTTARLNSKENLKARSKGEAARDVDDKARKNKTGKYAPKARKKAEAIKPIKTAGVKGVEKRKVAKLSTSEPTEKKAPKLAARRVSEPKKEVKKTRSQRIRAKGEAALASGNKTKALRLRKRMQRVEAREKRRADIKAKK